MCSGPELDISGTVKNRALSLTRGTESREGVECHYGK